MSLILKPCIGSRLDRGHPLSNIVTNFWVVNEGAGEIRDLITGIKATRVGSVPWEITPKGWGLNNGVNEGIVTNVEQPYLALTDNFTWNVNFRCDAQVSSDNVIFGNRNEGTSSPLQFFKIREGGVEFYYSGDVTTLTFTRVVAGSFYDITVVKLGTNLTLYINGVFTDSDTITATLDANPVYIGSGNAACNNETTDITFIHGGLFRGALTASQVVDYYINPYAMLEDTFPIELFGSVADKEGYAFGEENPTDENPESWVTWSDGAAGSPTIIGDADWGQLKVQLNASGQSAVKDLGSVKARIIVLKRDKYGSGSGSITIYIRGQAATFNQDDGSPSWEEYTIPIRKDWRYIQAKVEYSD